MLKDGEQTAGTITLASEAEEGLWSDEELAEDGVPPGGVADQGTGIRRSGTVAPRDQGFNSPQQGASWAAASVEIVRGLIPERVTLDPLHHDAGHDLAEPSMFINKLTVSRSYAGQNLGGSSWIGPTIERTEHQRSGYDSARGPPMRGFSGTTLSRGFST
jgi:hypothetical protein